MRSSSAPTLAVAIDAGLTDRPVSQLLAEVGPLVTKLGRRDEPIAILVEDFEGLLDLLLAVGVLDFSAHHSEELWEVDRAVAVSINLLVDHVLGHTLGRVLTQGPPDCSKLLGGDGAIAVLVEQRENLPELGDLLLNELASHLDEEDKGFKELT